MRLFVALDIPDGIRARMLDYMERARGLAPDARWARPEGLHVTLKFIGEVSDTRVREVQAGLATIRAAAFAVAFEGVGFFPSARAPRVFWIGVKAGTALPQLAAAIDDAVQRLGIAREERPYSPHLTLARAGARPGAQHHLPPLAALSESSPPPQFGTMTAREFFLYWSQPQRGGSKYTKLERFSLGEV